jgi:hypothetical protein
VVPLLEIAIASPTGGIPRLTAAAGAICAETTMPFVRESAPRPGLE